MSYEFTKFYAAVCRKLGVDPSEAPEGLFWAVSNQFDALSCDGVLTGSFVSSVQDAVDAIRADEYFNSRIDRIEDVQDGDLVTVTVPIYESEGLFYFDLRDPIYDEVAKKKHPLVTFHHATRKGFHVTR